MNSAQREKLIMMLFPAVAIALVWLLWLRPVARSQDDADVQAAGNEMKVARATAPGEAVLETKRRELAQLETTKTELQAAVQFWQQRWTGLRSDYQNDQHRAQTVQRVAEVFRRHDLTLIREESPSEGAPAANGTILATVFDRFKNESLQELIPELAAARAAAQAEAPQPLDTFAAAARAPKPTLWRIEFAGRYSDVQATLAELAESGLRAIPVRLSMAKVKPDLTLRRWTLLIWL